MSNQIINKNIMYGIFAIVYYGLTRHTVRKKYQCEVYCTTELSENLCKGHEISRIAKMLIQFTTTVILGHYQFSGNFTKQILNNYEWKHFCYNIRKYFLDQSGRQGCRNG